MTTAPRTLQDIGKHYQACRRPSRRCIPVGFINDERSSRLPAYRALSEGTGRGVERGWWHAGCWQ